jgi:hypothetical protein
VLEKYEKVLDFWAGNWEIEFERTLSTRTDLDNIAYMMEKESLPVKPGQRFKYRRTPYIFSKPSEKKNCCW